MPELKPKAQTTCTGPCSGYRASPLLRHSALSQKDGFGRRRTGQRKSLQGLWYSQLMHAWGERSTCAELRRQVGVCTSIIDCVVTMVAHLLTVPVGTSLGIHQAHPCTCCCSFLVLGSSAYSISAYMNPQMPTCKQSAGTYMHWARI